MQALRRTRRARLALALLALHLLVDVLGERLAKERPRVVLVVVSALCGLRHPAHGLVHRVLHLTHLGGRHASVCAGGGGAWHDDGSMQCTAMIVTRGDNEQKK